MRTISRTVLACAIAAVFFAPVRLVAEEAQDPSAEGVKKGLAALPKMQNEDGHWGDKFPVAITSICALSILAADEDPFKNEAMWKAYDWLLTRQKDGDFSGEGHTWLHSQGFATLYLAELYGRALMAKEPPARIKMDELKKILEGSVDLIERAQTADGGWFYQRDPAGQHEGSTTVCAVQALRAAQNFGIKVKKETLAKGFGYLKETQCPDGGFEYQKGSGSSMVAGTSGALATLVLMSKLDEKVLMDAMGYLAKTKVEGLAADRFPDYGLFYAMMAMTVIDEEYGKSKPEAAAWKPAIAETILKQQKEDGTWANIGWMKDNETSPAYATGLYTLTLAGAKGRLSIFHRDPPELPEKK